MPENTPDLKPGRPSRVRFGVLGVLFLLAIVTYIDRVCISLAAPWITAELHLTPVEMGAVFSTFAVTYALFAVPTAWLGDRFGARRVLAGIVFLWSAFTAVTGMVYRFAALLVVQFLFGATQAGAYPNITRAVANWFPADRRGSAMGTVWMGSRLGAALTPPLALLLMRRYGWRVTFYLLGALALIWVCGWLAWYRDDPAKKKSVNALELELIRAGRFESSGKPLAPGSWKSAFTHKNLWALYLMYFNLGFVYYLYISWFPTYLLRDRGVEVAQLGFYASLPLAFSCLANLLGGITTDKLVRRWGLVWGRRGVGIAGCAASAAFLLAGLQVKAMPAAILLISLAPAACDFTLASSWATCADIGGPLAGTISGAMNMVGNVGSVLSPILMGFLVQTTGKWGLTFYIAALLNVAGALLWFTINPARKLEN